MKKIVPIVLSLFFISGCASQTGPIPSPTKGALEQPESPKKRLNPAKPLPNLPPEKTKPRHLTRGKAILIYSNVDKQDMVQIVKTEDQVFGRTVSIESFLKAVGDADKQTAKQIYEKLQGLTIAKDSKRQSFPKPGEKKNQDELTQIINLYREQLKKSDVLQDRGIKVKKKGPRTTTQNDRTRLSRRLYDFLIAPHESYIQGKKELLIIPDGILAFLPFETLVDPQGRYLAEKFRITYTQSLGILDIVKKRQYSDNRKPMIAFGGAVYDPATYEGDMVTTEDELAYLYRNLRQSFESGASLRNTYGSLGIINWTNLPGTLSEVRDIAAIVSGAKIITGKKVSEELIKSLSAKGQLSQYKVIHFATHGITVPQIPELSAVVLSQFEDQGKREDGFLSMGEIARLKLKADFVNLSACETGLGKIFGGEGVVGLIHAFMIAGANSISASLWVVDDDSTSIFMKTLYQLVEEQKMSYSDAMTKVKRKFIRGDFGAKYKDPFYWAPFVYYGMN